MTARIARVTGRQVWDSRGRPTVEAEVWLESGAMGRAIAPAGASRGRHEAHERRDGGTRLGGQGVDGAVGAIVADIAPALIGLDARDQAVIDATLAGLDGTPNFARLGGNATVATSMAVLHAAAAHARLPLWQWLAQGRAVRLPVPQIQIFGGGAHAGRRTDIQDFMVVCPHARSFRHALELTHDVYRAAGQLLDARGPLQGVADEGGWWPAFASNEDALDMLARAIDRSGHRGIFIAVDIAASELGDATGYALALDGDRLTPDAMAERVIGWARRYPILSIEDPAGQDDWGTMAAVTTAIGDGVQLVGDDALVTNAARVAAAADAGACNALLVKVNQAGTVSAAAEAMEAARARGWGTIVSARSGESEDVTIAHLATGWDAGQLKVGSFSRSERMAKWNEMLRIEEAMGADAQFAGAWAFPAAIARGLA